MAAAGLRLVFHLQSCLLLANVAPSLDLMVCLAAYSDAQAPWVWPGSNDIAIELLSSFKYHHNSPKSIAQSLLKDRLQPLFVGSKSKTVTEQGWKSINPVPGRTNAIELEVVNKPWKYQSVHMITVFRWLLQQLDV